MQIIITPNVTGNPPGQLAEAALHFGPDDGPLSGLKLIGFAIWERRGAGGKNVTFPARQYTVNGERRSYAQLRPIEHHDAQNVIRQAIIDAYEAHVADGTQTPTKEATQSRIDF